MKIYTCELQNIKLKQPFPNFNVSSFHNCLIISFVDSCGDGNGLATHYGNLLLVLPVKPCTGTPKIEMEQAAKLLAA